MKKMYKFLVLALLVVSITGCEEFLDEPKPTDSLTAVDIYGSEEGVDAYLSGIYRKFRRQHNSTTDVGGIYSMYFARTIKGNDLIQAPTWYLFDYAHDNREPTYRRTLQTWVLLYDLLDHANSLMAGVEQSELSDVAKAAYIAHAKALRAYFLFQLALEYQGGYPSVGASADAPPIYLESTVEPKPMSTMGEIYAQILLDINEAIDGLPDGEGLGKSYINKSVANGIKARVLMAMDQSWDQVELAAKAAYGGDADAALTGDYTDGFDDISNNEWLWGLDQQEDQSNYYYCAPHAFTDHFTLSYQATFVNVDFVNSFSDTDVRKLFVNAYEQPDGSYRQFVTTKFTFTFASDIPTMRKPEFVLAEAEALHRQGKAGAHDLLFEVQSARDPEAVKSSNTGDALLEEILLERRKELYGEIGVEWFDAKRLQRGLPRTANHRVPLTSNPVEPNDKRLFLKIPQNEIDSNPNISDDVNSNR